MNTSNLPPEQPVKLYEVFTYAKDEKHAFLTADLLFGSAALWIPILLGLMFYSKTSPWSELIKLLDSGGGYTFSLAYLAAGSSFLYLERRKKTVNDFRDEISPNIWTWVQVYLVFGIVLTGAHFSYQILVPNTTNTFLNSLEFLYFVLAIHFGVRLFCLKNIEKLPGKLEQYRKREDEKAKKIAEARDGEEPY